MNQPAKYEPPEAVVAPAFRELLDRLRRARFASAKSGEINTEERKAFDYGVQQRRRVLEHTLVLAFGQWALYKQFISTLKSRPLRISYAIASVFSTASFLQHRAMGVSKDTFAHIVTTSCESALGNEARIVLAELEGPDGPYFRQVCHERSFQEDFVAIVAAQHDTSNPVSDLHPQLRLKPRLLIPNEPTPVDVRRAHRPDSSPLPPLRQTRTPPPLYASGPRDHPSYNDPELQQVPDVPAIPTTIPDMAQRASYPTKNSPDQWDAPSDPDPWGRPFDFSQSAHTSNNAEFSGDPVESQRETELGEQHSEDQYLTPSQRRAAERRHRREKGRMRSQGSARPGE